MVQRKIKLMLFCNILGTIAIICLFCSNFVIASTFSITTKGQLLDIKAIQVPLIDILKSISEKTGLIIENSDSLAEPISIDMKEVSIEECLNKLMEKRNYIIMFSENEENNSVPEKLLIFGSGSAMVIKNNIAPPPSDKMKKIVSFNNFEDNSEPPMNDHMKKYKKDWFKGFLMNSETLDEQISAVPISDGPLKQGILMTNVSANSVFSEIGIKEGDIIKDVNGCPIKTSKQLINQLHTPSENNLIRIDRRNNVGKVDPIYIQLQ